MPVFSFPRNSASLSRIVGAATSPAGGGASLMTTRHGSTLNLPRNSNQARGIGEYALDFLNGKYGEKVAASVYDRVTLFHTDSVMCGVSALALKTNAPTILRSEALECYRTQQDGACVFGSAERVSPEKAIAANSSAVREWDSNGTVFGFNPNVPGHQAGEFGHNDFYPVVIAAAQMGKKLDGKQALKAMIALDEIRGRLAEVFSLKTYKIDHVVHGAVASAAVYGALLGATVDQIEAAIGMVVAHYIPWRAIRAGKQLSDSKGASAALSTEVAIMSIRRAMRGFIGPKDIFRNPESVFRYSVPTPNGESPFDLRLSVEGDDFSVMGMHFKLGLYEHQSAGVLEGLQTLISQNPNILKGGVENIKGINIVAYEPAFGIIGDPAKRDPQSRQSADHSMVYIVATMLRKALKMGDSLPRKMDDVWCKLMLTPFDYGKESLANQETRQLMERIKFEHGGEEFDKKYPEGIPSTIEIATADGQKYSSGFVMFPSGHARNTTCDLKAILKHKFEMLGEIAMESENAKTFLKKLENIQNCSNGDLQDLYNFSSLREHQPID